MAASSVPLPMLPGPESAGAVLACLARASRDAITAFCSSESTFLGFTRAIWMASFDCALFRGSKDRQPSESAFCRTIIPAATAARLKLPQSFGHQRPHGSLSVFGIMNMTPNSEIAVLVNLPLLAGDDAFAALIQFRMKPVGFRKRFDDAHAAAPALIAANCIVTSCSISGLGHLPSP